jgi:CheY-like chemotaxis protein
MGYKEPIVALTANAVMGQAQVFIENGFDGFISKPIDMRELNIYLNRLIRDKQPPEIVEAARQQMGKRKMSYDLQKSDKVDNDLIKMALHDINKAIAQTSNLMQKIDGTNEEDMKLYVTTVHGMKSVLLHLNENGLSADAYRLEQAGDANALDTILAETPVFLDKIRDAVKKHQPDTTEAASSITQEDLAMLLEKLLEVKKACKHIKKSAARASLDILREVLWPQGVNDLLDEISVYLLHGEFRKAITIVDKAISIYEK